jgi:hypothetical protein
MIPADVYKEFVKTGTAMADAKLTFRQLDDATKSLLAQLTLEAKALEGVNSMAEAKEIALSASTYRDHIKAVAIAENEYLRAKVRYEATQALFQAQRTMEATHRAAGGAAT